jgi:hypothetical protein
LTFFEFSTNSYKFLKITEFELKGGIEILQPGPREDLNQCNQVPGSLGKRAETRRSNSGGEGGPTREDLGTRAVLAGGDVMVGVDRRGWNGGDPRRRQWSSTTAAVFRRGVSPAVVQRLGKSLREVRRFD